jgi:hypothetical protein
MHMTINGCVNSLIQGSDRKANNYNSEINVQKTLSKTIIKKVGRKVVIVGDSHSRGLATRLKDKLLNSYEVVGYTKPNCGLQTLLSTDNQDSAKLTKEDVLVLILAMNDVTRNNCSKELRCLAQFVERNRQTNIILITSPLRYDQITNIYINDDIRKYNRKLMKYMKLSEHVTILESPQSRDCFTRHGLHYNRHGKDSMCDQLAVTIDSMFQYTDPQPISLGWDDKQHVLVEKLIPIAENVLSSSPIGVAEENNKPNEYNAHRISTRQKRLPVNRTEDFLW